MKKKIFSHFVFTHFLIGVNIIGLPEIHTHINKFTKLIDIHANPFKR